MSDGREEREEREKRREQEEREDREDRLVPDLLTNGSPSAANPDFLIGIGFEEQKEREEQKETTGP